MLGSGDILYASDVSTVRDLLDNGADINDIITPIIPCEINHGPGNQGAYDNLQIQLPYNFSTISKLLISWSPASRQSAPMMN
jgi:hypothetical protein